MKRRRAHAPKEYPCFSASTAFLRTRLRQLRIGDGSLPDRGHATGRDPFPNPPSGCCTGSSGAYCGARFFRHIETDDRAKKIHTAKRIAKPTSSRQVIAFLPDTPASATASALAVGYCGHPACGRITDRETPVTKIRRAHACSVRPLRDSFVPASRIRRGGWPAPERPTRPFRAAAAGRPVRRTDNTRRGGNATERSYAISTSGVTTTTVSPSATSTCLTVPA